jgi:hypothetical protein
MNKEYRGESKTVLKFLGFLVNEYQMIYLFQSFDEYLGFYGPINTYSFYNKQGCFTLLQVVQRGEWGWYISKKIHTNLYNLLETEIVQNDFVHQSTFSYRKNLKILRDIIRDQLEHSQQFFGVVVQR